jgi:conjugative transfer signal peptidase TraF
MKLKPLGIALLALALLYLAVSFLKIRGYFFTYQVTASMPKGFYLVKPGLIRRNDIVVFSPPKPTLEFLRQERWIPKDGLLMKYVVGMPGDYVCQKEGSIWLNQRIVGPVYKFYAPGKILPNAKFCGRLLENEYLLVSTKISRSFDGRYFGPINYAQIKGRAYRIW